MSVVKIYLLNGDSTAKEIRKFHLSRTQAENFDEFLAKVYQLFPEVRNENFTIFYTDNLDDKIRITNNEELKLALHNIPLRFYVNIIPKNKENQIREKKIVKHNAVCDGCGIAITGFRYKCIQCDNFDICEQCECMGLHPDHFMLRMPRPLEYVHLNGVLHHMKNLIKKDSARSSKRHSSSRHASCNSCSIPIRLEGFPDCQNLGDAILDIIIADREPSKGEEAKEKEPKANAYEDKSATKNFSGETTKLVDDVQDDSGAASDASVASQDNSSAKVACDEWTILDKDETAEIHPSPSASSNSRETNVLLTAPTAPTLSTNESISEPIYPPLPSMTNVTHHPNPTINKAVHTLIDMGFSNQNNLLTYLLISNNGDINKVIELLLQPESTKYLVKN